MRDTFKPILDNLDHILDNPELEEDVVNQLVEGVRESASLVKGEVRSGKRIWQRYAEGTVDGFDPNQE